MHALGRITSRVRVRNEIITPRCRRRTHAASNAPQAQTVSSTTPLPNAMLYAINNEEKKNLQAQPPFPLTHSSSTNHATLFVSDSVNSLSFTLPLSQQFAPLFTTAWCDRSSAMATPAHRTPARPRLKAAHPSMHACRVYAVNHMRSLLEASMLETHLKERGSPKLGEESVGEGHATLMRRTSRGGVGV